MVWLINQQKNLCFTKVELFSLWDIPDSRDIAVLIWNLSNLDDNLFPDWNGMPYKCMQNTSPIYSRTV